MEVKSRTKIATKTVPNELTNRPFLENNLMHTGCMTAVFYNMYNVLIKLFSTFFLFCKCGNDCRFVSHVEGDTILRFQPHAQNSRRAAQNETQTSVRLFNPPAEKRGSAMMRLLGLLYVRARLLYDLFHRCHVLPVITRAPSLH